MNRDLERELQARFPGFFRDLYGDPRKTGMSRGCEFADGWYRLLERRCEELEPVAPPEFRFDQVKEKLGEMRVHASGGNEETERLIRQAREMRIYASGGNEETERLIRQAREESLRVCEECGATEGVDTGGSGWIRTLCQSCWTASGGPDPVERNPAEVLRDRIVQNAREDRFSYGVDQEGGQQAHGEPSCGVSG